MITKFALIFIVASANPAEQYEVQSWPKLFPTYNDCLTQAALVDRADAVLKDCKPVEIPGDPPPETTAAEAPAGPAEVDKLEQGQHK
jgi:hypothetical protein